MDYQTPGWRAYTLYRAKPVHVGHMIRELQERTGKFFDRNPDNFQDKINWLNDNFSIEVLDETHKRISRGYQSGEFAKRGRAFGSRNRASRYFAASMPHSDAGNSHAPPTSVPTADTSPPSTPSLQDLDDLLRNYVSKAELNTCISNIRENRPTIVHIQPLDAPAIDTGVQHKTFPTLLNYCRAMLPGNRHLNIWLYGPAGSGKSMACENVAKALGRDFRSNGKTAEMIELMGYRDAMGNYHTTKFREAYENGYIYCGDEMDSWLPDASIALNNALANGHCAFPDKIVQRHPNFIFIGAANTTGKGGTIEYVARFQHDAAFLDRFVTLEFPHDNSLEDHCVTNKEWLERVRYVRNRCMNTSTIKNHLITMRAAIFGQSLLAAGIDQEQVEKSTLRKGLTDAQWAMIE